MRLRTVLLSAVLLTLVSGIAWPLARHLWANYHFRAARQSLEQRDFAAADSHLDNCFAVWGDDPAAHLLAAQSARRQGRYAEAQRHLARCRNAEGAALETTLLRVQRGELGDRENYLKRTIGPDHPNAVLVLEALAVGYVKTDRLASLLECTDLWLQVRPENPQALFWRGYAFERLRHADKASDCYQRAIAADPCHDDARLHLGNLLLQSFRRPQEALEQFESARTRQPENPAILLGLVRCHRLLEQPDQAQQLVEALLERNPRMAEALSERGQLALAQGRLAEAENDLREATTLAPDDRQALYQLGQCLHQRGRDRDAWLCEQQLGKLEADLAQLDRLIAEVSRHPDDPDLRRQAGLICLRYGKKEEGLHWLQSALQVSPNDPATHTALAEYHKSH